MEEKYIEALLTMVPYFVKEQNMWVKYDKDADVLYIDVLNSDRVDHAILTEHDYIIRYRRGEIAGITVLDASRRKQLVVSNREVGGMGVDGLPAGQDKRGQKRKQTTKRNSS